MAVDAVFIDDTSCFLFCFDHVRYEPECIDINIMHPRAGFEDRFSDKGITRGVALIAREICMYGLLMCPDRVVHRMAGGAEGGGIGCPHGKPGSDITCHDDGEGDGDNKPFFTRLHKMAILFPGE